MIIHTVEQGTDEWLSLRLGMPTASNFKKIFTASGKPSTSADDYMHELIAEEMSGVPTFTKVTDDMQRGLDLENEAVGIYEFLFDVQTVVVGFVTNNEQTYGCSPDRFNLEVKCPKDKNHIKWALADKVPTDHFCQVQGCMWVCEQDSWDFLSYTQSIGTFCTTVYRDEKWIDGMQKEMDKFLNKKHEALHKLTQQEGNRYAR